MKKMNFKSKSSDFSLAKSAINKDLGERDWGKETLLHLAEHKWSMKRLFIKAGSKGGLQYHRVKDEAAFLIEGELIVHVLDDESNLIEKRLLGFSSLFGLLRASQETALESLMASFNESCSYNVTVI